MATGRGKYYHKGRGCFVRVHGTFSRNENDLYLFVMKDPNWCPSVWLHGDFLLPSMTWLRVAINKSYPPSNGQKKLSYAILYLEGSIIFLIWVKRRKIQRHDRDQTLKLLFAVMPTTKTTCQGGRLVRCCRLLPLTLTGTRLHVSAHVCQFPCTQKVNPMGQGLGWFVCLLNILYSRWGPKGWNKQWYWNWKKWQH